MIASNPWPYAKHAAVKENTMGSKIGINEAFRMMGVELEPHRDDPTVRGSIVTFMVCPSPKHDGRDIVGFVGVMTAPNGLFTPIKQITVIGGSDGRLILDLDNQHDRNDMRGMGAAAILTSPIWPL